MFIKLEDVLICESNYELSNLHLLMGLHKAKRKNSKKKSSKERQPGVDLSFIYLRPFIKAFLSSLKLEFKLVLYSFKDPKTVQNITQNINEVFEQDLFDAYVALPANKQTENFCIEQFMSEKEHRTVEN
jgi:hypothetical protein